MIKKLLILTTLVGLSLQAYYSLQLPAAVANHFGPGGVADGWMANTTNLLLSSGVLAMIAFLYLLLPFVLNRAPLEVIAFPNRRYWLDPNRRARTVPTIAAWLGCSGWLTILFLLAVYHLIYLANQVDPPRLDQGRFLFIFYCYLGAMLIWLIALLIKFGRRPK